MKSHTEELWFAIPSRRGFVNITPQVEKLLNESGVQEGLCLVNAMHITASVFINDDERGLHSDYDSNEDEFDGDYGSDDESSVDSQDSLTFPTTCL